MAADADDVVRPPTAADRRRRFERAAAEIGHFEHAIGDQADAQFLSFDQSVGDDDPRSVGRLDSSQAELGAQVDQQHSDPRTSMSPTT